MPATQKTRYTIQIEANEEAEDIDLFGLYEDGEQARIMRDLLNKKLSGTGYTAYIQVIYPHRSAKTILEHLKIS